MQSSNNVKFMLTYQEITDIRGSVVPASKEFIVKTLSKWDLYIHELTVLCVDKSSKIEWNWYAIMKTTYDFLLDPSGDTFIADLMKLSLSYNIILLKQCEDDFGAEVFKVYLEESKDGSTNIDADVVEAFQRTIERQFQQ